MKRTLSILLSFIMIITLLPASIFAQDSDKRKAIQFGTSGIKDPVAVTNDQGTYYKPSDYIYFGTINGNPIKWRVLDGDKTNIDTDGMFLLSEDTLDNAEFNETSGTQESVTYQGSNGQKWCKGFIHDNFSSIEQATMLGVSKTDEEITFFDEKTWGVSTITEDDKMFFLSTGEIIKYLGNYYTDVLKSDKTYWLRSYLNANGEDKEYWYIGVVTDKAYVASEMPNSSYGNVRPAFNLDTSNVLLISAKDNGKSTGEGLGKLNEVGNTDSNEWKLTLKDDSRTIDVSTKEVSVYTGGGTVYIDFSNVNYASSYNEYVSALLVNSNNEILYYGHIASNCTSGRKSIDIPNLVAGEYTLKIFNEQCNDGTDYASDFEDVKLNVVEDTVHGDHHICGKTDCSHTTDEHDASVEWVGIDSLSDIDKDGNYYLKNNIYLDNDYWICNYNVNLCLNGKRIASSSAYTITVPYGKKLEITDCREIVGTITNISMGNIIKNEGDLILWKGNISECNSGMPGAGIWNDGNFTMNGGSVSNNSSSSTGGAGVYNLNSFVMNGGTISNNTTEYNGGGVYNCGGIFRMTGGTISNNSATKGGGIYNDQYNGNNGTINLSGEALVSNNIATSSGGGVYNTSYGTVTMSDKATISGNSSKSSDASDGGGVFNTGTFNMLNNSNITNNSSASNGGGIASHGGSINMYNNTSVTNNTATTNGSGIYINGMAAMEKEPIKLSNSVIISENATDNLYLDSGVTVAAKELTEGAKIGVTTDTKPSEADSVVITNDEVTKNYFESDDDNYVAVKNDDNKVVLMLSSAHTHLYEWKYDDEYHWQVCSTCNKELEKSKHSGGTATCISKAICDTCKQEYGDINPDNHSNLIHVEAKDHTTSSVGNIEYWYCDGCKKYFSDKEATKEIAKESTQISKLQSIDNNDKKESVKSYDPKDKNHDGVISCDEEMNSTNWTWSETKKACVYRVTNTSAK